MISSLLFDHSSRACSRGAVRRSVKSPIPVLDGLKVSDSCMMPPIATRGRWAGGGAAINAGAKNSSTVVFKIAAAKWREYGIVAEILSIKHGGLRDLNAGCVGALVPHVSTG